MEPLTEPKEVAGDVEGEEVRVSDKKAFAVVQLPLFYTHRRFPFQQNPRNKRLTPTGAVRQAVHIRQNRPLLLLTNDNAYYYLPGEVRTTDLGWTTLMTNILILVQKERLCNVRRKKYEFMLVILAKQKSPACMKDIIQLFTNQWTVDRRACSGTSSVGKNASVSLE